MRQSLVALDMEGVLTPEIWVAVAERTGVEALSRTTRDEPDYDVLMRGRLELLERHKLRLSDIQEVIATLRPLEGAVDFLRELRAQVPVVILSDTFEQFAEPLIRQLDWPLLLCHRLVVREDRVIDYRLRLPEQKQAAVAAFKRLNYRVIAGGDSVQRHQDAHGSGCLDSVRAPPNVRREFPRLPAVTTHGDLLAAIRGALTYSAAGD